MIGAGDERGPKREATLRPAVFVGVLAALFAAGGGGRHRPTAPIAAASVVAFLIWMIVWPAWFFELGLLADALASGDFVGALVALGLLAPTTVVLLPWPIARWLLIPRGQVRLSWALTRLSFWVWRGDVRGGALIAASWAAARRGQSKGATPSTELLDWVERRLRAVPSGTVRWKLGGAGIIAAGLLAEARGDRGLARRMLASAGELSEPTRPRRAIAFAWEWLCAEAIGRGAWREVEFVARTAPVETRTTKLLGAIAARLTGIAPLPTDLRLRWLWLIAPRRLGTRELLRRALAAPATPPPPTEDAGPPPDPVSTSEHTLLAAMTLHAQVLASDPASLARDTLSQLARAWDRALADAKLEDHLTRRGEELGAHDQAQSPQLLSELVRDDLLGLVRDAGLELGQLGQDSDLLGRAARSLHGELLDGLEISMGALESRVDLQRELPALDEWRAFLSLREQYAEAVSLGGLQLRRLAFGSIHGPVCSLAVWLWNERNERAIGNAIFHWLLAEAVIVDDAEAIRLQERNVDCGI